MLDAVLDRQMIINEVLMPCAKFYSDYTKWEDNNIIEDELSKFN